MKYIKFLPVLALLSFPVQAQEVKSIALPFMAKVKQSCAASMLRDPARVQQFMAMYKRDITGELCECAAKDSYETVFADMTLRQLDAVFTNPSQKDVLAGKMVQSVARCLGQIPPAQ